MFKPNATNFFGGKHCCRGNDGVAGLLAVPVSPKNFPPETRHKIFHSGTGRLFLCATVVDISLKGNYHDIIIERMAKITEVVDLCKYYRDW